jgi:ATP-binding protein involved in chromosome partitioning
MPIDATTYRFRCTICEALYQSEDRAQAYAWAEACEHQGIEVEPLPNGTFVLTHEWEPEVRGQSRGARFELRQILAHEVGSGQYQRGEGHQVLYELDGDEKARRRPYEIKPHLPGQVNVLFEPHRDQGTVGDRLERHAFHSGEKGAGVAAAVALLEQLLGHAVDPVWFAGLWASGRSNPDPLPMLPPRAQLSPELDAALALLARPSEPGELSNGAADRRNPWRERGAQRVRQALHEIGNSDRSVRIRPDFPNPDNAAWALALEATGSDVAQARVWMFSHSNEIETLLEERAAAWWAGAPVSLPAMALCPAEGTKSAGMTRTQLDALNASGDIQMEASPHRYGSSYGRQEPEWRAGAIHVLSEPPKRSNQKHARYRPVDAIAGLVGWHPEVTQIMQSSDPNRPTIPVICVASGKGGVGKSSVAAALAQRLTAEGVQATVVDLDVEGPSLSTLLELSPVQADENGRMRPERLADGSGAWSPGQLFRADKHLYMDESMIEALLGFLAGSLDLDGDQLLVVDLPPGTSDMQAIVQKLWKPLGTVLVTTGAKVAHADLRRAFGVSTAPVGLIENLTRVEVEVDGEKHEARLYDGASSEELAKELDLVYLGSLPHQPELAALAASAEMGQLAAAVRERLATEKSLS